ncbi:MAG: peptidoglycan-binding protein [Clostridia bacterium]|nr:peptidoglycan-binding protein [Clostridia bacterium]
MKTTKRIICSLVLVLLFTLEVFTGFSAGLITYGKENEDIRLLQMRLTELGYFTHEADGYFGDETVMALENFQTANGLASTGLADPETVEKINDENAITKKEYIDSVRALNKMDYAFSTGDKGKLVKRLQSLLFEKGYLEASVTEEYTKDVEKAVCLFQLINNIPVTGIADGDMIALLLSPACIDLNEYDKKIVLAYGDSGTHVKMLQLELKRLGYFNGDCSAKFGKNTQDAVYEYQKWNGLEQNGECGIDMRIKLAKNESLSYSEALAQDAVSALYEGDIAEAVEKVKNQLYELGFYTGLIDTEFTHELSEAVYFFQLANNIQTTGSADKATRLLLNSGECVTMEEFTKEMSEVSVKKGDVGHQVVLLQRRLLDLGYTFEMPNGSFGKKTEEAVKRFQMAHGFEMNGIADTEIRKLMNSDDAFTYAEYVQLEELKIAQTERMKMVDVIVNEAMSCVDHPYEAGRVGEDVFGNAGLAYSVYMTLNQELHPTIALQYESAVENEAWNEDRARVSAGDQVFFYAGETMLTGICVGEDAVVFASPIHNRVVLIENFMESKEYVFIGSISYV